MQKNKKQKAKKIQNLIIFAGFSAIILVVSTYAWFIGQQEVGIDEFSINIAAAENLMLSLNGVEWDDQIDLDGAEGGSTFAGPADAATAVTSPNESYFGHTNSWGTGLMPVSTSGQVDLTNSVLTMYEKSSMTRTDGGYRLMSTAIDNSTEEHDGYVAFDLFIRNFNGAQYNETYRPSEEEEIFLTIDSSADVFVNGTSADGAAATTGIENSIRVAFMPIGRVVATEDEQSVLAGISCDTAVGTVTAGVTTICDRTQIWEPNETAHAAEAIYWFAQNCNTRTGADNMADDAYDAAACTAIVDGTAAVTNTINAVIAPTDMVDVYDGHNGYTATIGTEEDSLLTTFNTFTDTEKLIEGDPRPAFMYLAPNSITKVRVYIYLEGMDLDSQDLAENISEQITINFGFTKQQYATDATDDQHTWSTPEASSSTP